MDNTHVHFIGSRECKYSIDGRKLTEYRRARLRIMAMALSISPEGSKNSLLRRIIAKLDALGVESELPKELLY